MNYNEKKVDEIVLALIYLTSFKQDGVTRAWKGHDWEVLNRLHNKGFISDPKSKAKSVILSDAGVEQSKNLFKKHFCDSNSQESSNETGG